MDLIKIFIGFIMSIFMALPTKSSSILTTSNVVSRLRRSEMKMCSELLPCQWGVYGNDANKRIQFTIDNNSCVCGEDRKCVIAEENLSMAAFIYRCVADSKSTTTPESPHII